MNRNGVRRTLSSSSGGSLESVHNQSIQQRQRAPPKKRGGKRRNSGGASVSGSLLYIVLAAGMLFVALDVWYVVSIFGSSKPSSKAMPPIQKHMPAFQQKDISEGDDGINPAGDGDDDRLKKQKKPKHDPFAHPESQSKTTAIDKTPPKKVDGEALADKEPLIEILREAKVPFDDELVARLPTWSQITALYGSEPKLYGLDSCQAFQTSSDPSQHFISTAGTFNTGTNLLAELLIHNCHMPARMKKYGPRNRGVRWQVLWGKHTPVGDEQFRLSHTTYVDPELNATNIFPVVTVRDPFKWMQSMCRHHYGAHWNYSSHCPNLIPSEEDLEEFPLLEKDKPVPVRVKYAEFTKNHDSLVEFWNEWYQEYIHAPFPRLIVRFEDIVFYPKAVTKIACECAGGELNRGGFRYVVDSAKKGAAHGRKSQRTSYVDALIKYGTEVGRYSGMNEADLEYARQHLDSQLMEVFRYNYPPRSLPSAS